MTPKNVTFEKLKLSLVLAAVLAASACASSGYRRYPVSHQASAHAASAQGQAPSRGLRRHALPPVHFRTWTDADPQYRLMPGDQLDIIVNSAPELSRLLLVGPDGRVQMPLAPPVMAANLTIDELEQHLRTALATQLVHPNLEITPRAFGSQRIFVGGEVAQPGMFVLPGQIGVMEAVMMAGGFRNSAKTSKVVLIRRHPDGGPMMKVINLKAALHKGAPVDTGPLQRGDVVFVPRSGIASIGLFMQQYIRDALPFSFSLSYYIGNSGNFAPTVSAP